jgi:hypothetical protein
MGVTTGARWSRGQCVQRAIVEAKQRRSVIGWVTKKLLFQDPCFGRHFMPLVPAAFAVVRTLKSALGPRGGLRPVQECCAPASSMAPAVWALVG